MPTLESNARKLFERFDRNHDGKLELDELQLVVRAWARSQGQYLSHVKVADGARRIMEEADVDNNGTVSLSEFIYYTSQLNSEAFADLMGWQDLFARYANKQTDTINKAGLTKLVHEVLFHTNKAAGLSQPVLSQEDIVTHVNHLLATAKPDNPHATEISFDEFFEYARVKKPEIFMALWEANLNSILPEEEVAETHIFVSEMNEMDELQTLFSSVDKDGNGRLDFAELVEFVKLVALSVGGFTMPHPEAVAFTKNMLQASFSLPPQSEHMYMEILMSFDAFKRFVAHHTGEFSKLFGWHHMFYRFADQHTHKISAAGAFELVDTILSVTKCEDVHCAQVERYTQELLSKSDTNHDGEISLEEFVAFAVANPAMFQPALQAIQTCETPGRLSKKRQVKIFEGTCAEALEDLFHRCDQDGNGRLDRRELESFVRKVLVVQGRRPPHCEVTRLALEVLNQARLSVKDAMDTETISLIEFILYIERCPELYGLLSGWSSLYERYCNPDTNVMMLSGLQSLVREIFQKVYGQTISGDQLQDRVEAYLEEMDVLFTGEIDFVAFVAYAQKFKPFGDLLKRFCEGITVLPSGRVNVDGQWCVDPAPSPYDKGDLPDLMSMTPTPRVPQRANTMPSREERRAMREAAVLEIEQLRRTRSAQGRQPMSMSMSKSKRAPGGLQVDVSVQGRAAPPEEPPVLQRPLSKRPSGGDELWNQINASHEAPTKAGRTGRR